MPKPLSFFIRAASILTTYPSISFHGWSIAGIHALTVTLLLALFFVPGTIWHIVDLSLHPSLLIFLSLGLIFLATYNRTQIITFTNTLDQKKTHLSTTRRSPLLRFVVFETSLLIFFGVILTSFFAPGTFLIRQGFWHNGLRVLNVGFWLFIIFFIPSFFVHQYGRLYLTLSQTTFKQTLENSLNLFQKFPKESFYFSVQSTLIRIFSLLLTTNLFEYTTTALSASFPPRGIYLLILLLFLVIYGWYETWTQIAWTLFFKELAGPHETDKNASETSSIILQEKGITG